MCHSYAYVTFQTQSHFYESWGFHGGEGLDYDFLCSDTVYY